MDQYLLLGKSMRVQSAEPVWSRLVVIVPGNWQICWTLPLPTWWPLPKIFLQEHYPTSHWRVKRMVWLMIAFHIFTFVWLPSPEDKGIMDHHPSTLPTHCSTLQHSSPFGLLAQPLLQASSLVLLSWLGPIQNPAQLSAGDVWPWKDWAVPPSVILLAESEMDGLQQGGQHCVSRRKHLVNPTASQQSSFAG